MAKSTIISCIFVALLATSAVAHDVNDLVGSWQMSQGTVGQKAGGLSLWRNPTFTFSAVADANINLTVTYFDIAQQKDETINYEFASSGSGDSITLTPSDKSPAFTFEFLADTATTVKEAVLHRKVASPSFPSKTILEAYVLSSPFQDVDSELRKLVEKKFPGVIFENAQWPPDTSFVVSFLYQDKDLLNQIWYMTAFFKSFQIKEEGQSFPTYEESQEEFEAFRDDLDGEAYASEILGGEIPLPQTCNIMSFITGVSDESREIYPHLIYYPLLISTFNVSSTRSEGEEQQNYGDDEEDLDKGIYDVRELYADPNKKGKYTSLNETWTVTYYSAPNLVALFEDAKYGIQGILLTTSPATSNSSLVSSLAVLEAALVRAGLNPINGTTLPFNNSRCHTTEDFAQYLQNRFWYKAAVFNSSTSAEWRQDACFNYTFQKEETTNSLRLNRAGFNLGTKTSIIDSTMLYFKPEDQSKLYLDEGMSGAYYQVSQIDKSIVKFDLNGGANQESFLLEDLTTANPRVGGLTLDTYFSGTQQLPKETLCAVELFSSKQFKLEDLHGNWNGVAFYGEAKDAVSCSKWTVTPNKDMPTYVDLVAEGIQDSSQAYVKQLLTLASSPADEAFLLPFLPPLHKRAGFDFVNNVPTSLVVNYFKDNVAFVTNNLRFGFQAYIIAKDGANVPSNIKTTFLERVAESLIIPDPAKYHEINNQGCAAAAEVVEQIDV